MTPIIYYTFDMPNIKTFVVTVCSHIYTNLRTISSIDEVEKFVKSRFKYYIMWLTK